jgi:hypothetical protein
MWQDTLTELRRFGGLRVNVLILGAVTSEQRDDALGELRAAAGRHSWRPSRTTPFELPIDDPSSIVVINQVEDLSTDDQQALLQWLDQHCDTMVLSFATNEMFRLVTNGTFSDRLFYRLNIITLRVDDRAA